MHELRRQLTVLGFERGEYSGLPVPIKGIGLVVEPRFAFAKAYNKTVNNVTREETTTLGPHWYDAYDLVNTFRSSKTRCDVVVIRHKVTGRAKFRIRPSIHSSSEMLATLFASDAWGVDQEQAALKTLGGMLNHRQFKQYLLTGMFMEKSPRSHVNYIFRRLRPTIAIGAIPPEKAEGHEEATILCALCMHPIAYYEGSWAGAMCPTDDVIAHLSLMRGDEHLFWKRSNQHHPSRSQAGIS